MFRLGADTVASLAFHLGTLLVLVVLAALLMRTQPRWRFVAIALAGLGIALAALFIDPLTSLTHALGLKWNWGGKLLSTLVILALMRFSPASFGEMGVKAWDGRGWRGALVCLGVMCALDWAVSFAFASGARTPSVEQLLFQATMPGLNEELIYRGFAMAMLDRAFGGAGRSVLGATIGPAAILSSLFFGVQHGTGFVDGQFAISWPTIALTGVLGILLAWMRARTGSVIAPMIAHNVVNVGHVLIG